jgi:hypothetical protein
MSVMAGIVLIAASIIALVLSRPRGGVALPFLRVWIVGQLYAHICQIGRFWFLPRNCFRNQLLKPIHFS